MLTCSKLIKVPLLSHHLYQGMLKIALAEIHCCLNSLHLVFTLILFLNLLWILFIQDILIEEQL